MWNNLEPLHLAPSASALQLLKSGTLSFQFFECVPVPTLFVVISRLTISSRPSSPLAHHIQLLLTTLRVYQLYLLTHLLLYLAPGRIGHQWYLLMRQLGWYIHSIDIAVFRILQREPHPILFWNLLNDTFENEFITFLILYFSEHYNGPWNHSSSRQSAHLQT